MRWTLTKKLDTFAGLGQIKKREVELDPQVSPEELKSREVHHPQVSPEELKSREVHHPQVSPEELKSREVHHPQVSPEEVKSREVELGSESWTSFAVDIVLVTVTQSSRNSNCVAC